MDIPILEIGAGGALVIVILKTTFDFVKSTRTSKNGVTKAEFEKHKDSVQYKDNCEQIVKRLDSAFIAQEKMFRLMEKRIEEHFSDVKKLIRNGAK